MSPPPGGPGKALPRARLLLSTVQHQGGVFPVSIIGTVQPNLRRRKINTQKLLVIFLFAVVPLFLLILFTYVPFVKMIQFSFHNMSYTKDKGFVGFDNYLRIFTKPEYVDAMLLSLYYMAGAVVQLALALFFASVLSLERLRGSGIYKAILFFPFLVNGIAIGYIFKYFYTHGFVLDTVLQTLGFPLERLPYWLRDQSVNNWSLVFTSVWKYCGQNMVLFIGAIASIDPTLYEAATIDGANRWQQFKAIILPGIKTVLKRQPSTAQTAGSSSRPSSCRESKPSSC